MRDWMIVVAGAAAVAYTIFALRFRHGWTPDRKPSPDERLGHHLIDFLAPTYVPGAVSTWALTNVVIGRFGEENNLATRISFFVFAAIFIGAGLWLIKELNFPSKKPKKR